jgi:uncharacterized membrane protein YfcA
LKLAGMTDQLPIAGQLSLIAIIVAAYLLAGFVKGVTGMGLPTVALALLASVMTPAQAAAILIVPSMITNLWQMFAGPYFVSVARRLAPMLAGLCVGAWLGAGILTSGNSKHAALGLGIALVAYAALGLSKIEFLIPRRVEVWAGPLVGVATGVVMAATGVFVLPALPYMQAIGLQKDELVQALGLHFTVSTIALAGVLWSGSAFNTQILTLSLIALVPALAGVVIGQIVRGRISLRAFRLCLFVLVLILGLQLAARNLM